MIWSLIWDFEEPADFIVEGEAMVRLAPLFCLRLQSILAEDGNHIRNVYMFCYDLTWWFSDLALPGSRLCSTRKSGRTFVANPPDHLWWSQSCFEQYSLPDPPNSTQPIVLTFVFVFVPSRHLHRRRLNRYSKSEQLCSPVLYLRSAESLTCIQACFCLNLIEKPRLSFGISYFVLIVVTVLYIESCPMSDPVNVTYMHMQYVLQYCFKSRSVKPKSAQKKRSPHRLLRGCDNVAVAVPCMRHK